MSNAKKISSILAAGALFSLSAFAGTANTTSGEPSSATDNDSYTTSMPENNSSAQQDSTVQDENDSIGGTGSTSDTLEGGSDTDTWTDTDTNTGTVPGMEPGMNPGTGSTGGATSSGSGSMNSNP
jgi:hypothetical protein